MVAATVYGYGKGDPRVLLIGWDSSQNGCGHSELTKDYPYLYFPQMPSENTLKDI